MDEVRSVITAIGDSRTESFVAASLARQGYEVLFRALTYQDLLAFLEGREEGKFPIFISPDLRGAPRSSQKRFENEILISRLPTSDFEVAELLRGSRDVYVPSKSEIPENIRVIGIASIGRRVGASTIAFNLATEVSLRGARTLLLDAHSRHPYLAAHTEIFGINRAPYQFSSHLTLFEGSSPEGAIDFSDFDVIVIDCGEVFKPAEMITGRRSEELAFSWVARHGHELFLVSRTLDKRVRTAIDEFCEIAIKPQVSYLINRCEPLQRKKLSAELQSSPFAKNATPVLLILDKKSVAAMEEERSSLAQSAPKSSLRHELLDLLNARNWWRN